MSTAYNDRNPILLTVPVANAFAGTLTTDVVSLENANGILFTIFKGAGAVGTTVVTALACDDVTPTTTHAVAFIYRKGSISTTSTIPGDWTAAAATGFTTTAAANEWYEIYVPAENVAHVGYGFVELVCTESVANAVLGGIMAELIGLRHNVYPLPEANA